MPVTVFEHNNYGGRSQELGAGYHAGPLAIGNDVVSSAKVPPGWRVTLYEHGPGTGRTKVLTADTPALPDFNDVTSNILVEELRPPGTEYNITLPANTLIGATAFANAGNNQDIVVSIEGAVVARFSGSGTSNKLLGATVFNSGTGRANVRIDSAGRPSQVIGNQTILANKLNFALIGSEDAGDADFNDGILVLNWPLG
jgi:hypothetical protein